MNILMNVHAYVPHNNAGAEKSFHDVAKALIKRGHDVVVIVPFIKDYEFEGVEVAKECRENVALWARADLIFTQLNSTGHTIQMSRVFEKKVVHFARNDYNYDMVRVREKEGTHYVVYNSEWVKRSLNYPLESYVMPPTVDHRWYDVGGDPYDREYITLINHNENKGGREVIEIARRMPDRRFLLVDGGYGDQINTKLPNVAIWPNKKDIREVYKVTRLLLMPSRYESWGRTCSEAMCNGIPVIHNDTPGLMENTDGRQIMINRDDIDGYVRAIEKMDNKNEYNKYSSSGRKIMKGRDPDKIMEGFINWLEKIVRE